jgi:hypothetical protein
MHMSSSCMFGEEEGLFGDLASCSSGCWNNGCSQVAKGGSGGDLSSNESEFLRKRSKLKGG